MANPFESDSTGDFEETPSVPINASPEEWVAAGNTVFQHKEKHLFFRISSRQIGTTEEKPLTNDEKKRLKRLAKISYDETSPRRRFTDEEPVVVLKVTGDTEPRPPRSGLMLTASTAPVWQWTAVRLPPTGPRPAGSEDYGYYVAGGGKEPVPTGVSLDGVVASVSVDLALDRLVTGTHAKGESKEFATRYRGCDWDSPAANHGSLTIHCDYTAKTRGWTTNPLNGKKIYTKWVTDSGSLEFDLRFALVDWKLSIHTRNGYVRFHSNNTIVNAFKDVVEQTVRDTVANSINDALRDFGDMDLAQMAGELTGGAVTRSDLEGIEPHLRVTDDAVLILWARVPERLLEKTRLYRPADPTVVLLFGPDDFERRIRINARPDQVYDPDETLQAELLLASSGLKIAASAKERPVRLLDTGTGGMGVGIEEEHRPVPPVSVKALGEDISLESARDDVVRSGMVPKQKNDSAWDVDIVYEQDPAAGEDEVVGRTYFPSKKHEAFEVNVTLLDIRGEVPDVRGKELDEAYAILSDENSFQVDSLDDCKEDKETKKRLPTPVTEIWFVDEQTGKRTRYDDMRASKSSSAPAERAVPISRALPEDRGAKSDTGSRAMSMATGSPNAAARWPRGPTVKEDGEAPGPIQIESKTVMPKGLVGETAEYAHQMIGKAILSPAADKKFEDEAGRNNEGEILWRKVEQNSTTGVVKATVWYTTGTYCIDKNVRRQLHGGEVLSCSTSVFIEAEPRISMSFETQTRPGTRGRGKGF